MIRALLPIQTHDPQRGSFMVHARPTGQKKQGAPVYVSAFDTPKDDRGAMRGRPTSHPAAFEFVVLYDS